MGLEEEESSPPRPCRRRSQFYRGLSFNYVLRVQSLPFHTIPELVLISISLRRSLSLLLLFTASSLFAFSQTTSDTDGSDHAGGLCGTEIMGQLDPNTLLANTARLSPALYNRMVARSKDNGQGIQSGSNTWDFYVSNRLTSAYDNITGVVVWEGKSARIWVDQADLDNAQRAAAIQAAIPGLARGLDSLTPASSRNPELGIVDNDEAVFGKAPTKFAADWDYKTNFLLTNIQDGFTGSGGYIAGFFAPNDQTSSTGSNQMNVLFIDSHEGLSGGVAGLLGTIAHEYQHLIHYGLYPSSEVFFNEGCSEVASIVCGYKSRSNSVFLSNTNVSMMRWSYSDNTQVLSDYARAMTFMHYMNEQYGESFTTKFAATKAKGTSRIAQALTGIGSSDTWQDVFKGFAVANYLQTYGADPRYGYKTRLSSSSAKVSNTYTGSRVPADTSLSVEAYASRYVLFSKPQGTITLRFRSDVSRKFAVMAMLTRNGSTTVMEMELNRDYVLGDDGIYDKIVIAFVSLESTTQAVAMNTQITSAPALGVDDQTIAAGPLSILATAPNPFTASTSIRFATPERGRITLQVFASDGTMVATLIDGEQFEAGQHTVPFNAEGLPNGYYVARLVQGGRSVTRSMVLAK
jgi:hypothetical protein